jgi:hypothetical protein
MAFRGIDGNSDPAHLAQRHRRVGVVADLRWQVKGHAESLGAVRQQEFVAPVRLFGVAHARVLAHGPQAAAVHRRLNAAGVRKRSRLAQLLRGVKVAQTLGAIDRRNRYSGAGGELFLWLQCLCRQSLGPALAGLLRVPSVPPKPTLRA